MISKMKKIEAQNCWEFWDCSKDAKEQCPVFTEKAGKECWMYTDNLKVFSWAIPKKHFVTCLNCPWYKHMHEKERGV